MKYLFTFLIGLILFSDAFAQKTAEQYLASVPQLTFNPCTADYEQKQKFKEDLGNFDTVMKADLEARQQQSEQFQAEHQEEEQEYVLKGLGYSEEQAKKLKNADQMSDAEKMAIANQMMMNKYNMDIDDLKKVAGYDTAAQRRWVKAQSTSSMADMDPEKTKSDQIKTKQDIDLRTELKFQNDKLRAGEDKYMQQLRKLDKEADSARIVLNEQLEKARKDLENCSNDQQRDQIKGHIENLMDDYCKQFTPKYLEIIEQYKGYIQKNLPDYYKLEELQIKSLESQTGVKNPNYKTGSVPMGMVGSYVSLLSESFKYSLSNNFGMLFIE
jgi:hypothetical protein